MKKPAIFARRESLPLHGPLHPKMLEDLRSDDVSSHTVMQQWEVVGAGVHQLQVGEATVQNEFHRNCQSGTEHWGARALQKVHGDVVRRPMHLTLAAGCLPMTLSGLLQSEQDGQHVGHVVHAGVHHEGGVLAVVLKPG